MTISWNEGCTTGMDYSNDFYRDLTPGILRMALLLHGVDMPKRKQRESLRYLHLGHGQGVSLNIHAAALAGDFWGTDSNPSYSLRTSELAQAAGTELKIYNNSFAELDAKSAQGELPQFDIIVLHNIWSGIDDVNRGHILSILNRNCKMGGIVYVSYNALPGWAAMAPLRDIIAMYSSIAGSESKTPPQMMGESYAFAQQLADTGARYFSLNPQAKSQLDLIGTMTPNQAAFEYCNKDWRPFYFADVARTMGMAKLSYVCSSRLLHEVATACLPPEGQQKLLETENLMLRETLRDYYMNQTFRADIFVKGEQRLSPQEQLDLINALRVTLVVHQDIVPASIPGPIEPLHLKKEIYKPVLEALADKNYASKTIADLRKHPLLSDMNPSAMIEAITVLTGAGYVHPAQDTRTAQKFRAACEKLNTALLQRVEHGEECPFLASPVLGGGLQCSSLEQLLLISVLQGEEQPEAWAKSALVKLAQRGQKLEREGTDLTDAESLEQIQALAQAFATYRLPLLKILGIVPAHPHSPENTAEE